MTQQYGKQAFLIMARHYSRQLNYLLKSLDNQINDIFLHVDKKSTSSRSQLYQCQESKLFEVTRIEVNWAAYSQISAEVVLLKKAVAQGPYEHYHLLSGSDLPIKSNNYIQSFFNNHHDEEFVSIRNINQPVDLKRVKYYYPLQEYIGKKHGFLWFIQKILMYSQKIIMVNRLKKNHFNLYGKGANWFSITDNLAKYLIRKESLITSAFKYGQAVDEMFVQTIILNSQKKFKLYHNGKANLRFIKWQSGNSPEVLKGSKVLSEMLDSGCVFARKFDEAKDKQIIDYLLKEIARSE